MIWIANKTCFYKSLVTFSWRHGGAHIPLHCRILLRKAAHLVWSVKYSHGAKYGERGNIFILQDKLWRHDLSWVDGMMTSPCCEAAVTAGWVVLRKSETLNESMSKGSQNAVTFIFKANYKSEGLSHKLNTTKKAGWQKLAGFRRTQRMSLIFLWERIC